MKTEQEVREAVKEGIAIPVAYDNKIAHLILTADRVQDLAVIIGKALGVVE